MAGTGARARGRVLRPLAAANIALEWPEAPHLVLWHAQTVLREQRGDGHVAPLLTAGLDPVEALVLFAADHAMDTEWLRRRRGWSEEEWSDAAHRLSERGLLGEGALTPAGRTVRAEVEARTDALADPPVAAIGAAAADRLVELVTPLVTAIVGAGGFLATNPMGLRPLVPTR